MNISEESLSLHHERQTLLEEYEALQQQKEQLLAEQTTLNAEIARLREILQGHTQ